MHRLGLLRPTAAPPPTRAPAGPSAARPTRPATACGRTSRAPRSTGGPGPRARRRPGGRPAPRAPSGSAGAASPYTPGGTPPRSQGPAGRTARPDLGGPRLPRVDRLAGTPGLPRRPRRPGPALVDALLLRLRLGLGRPRLRLRGRRRPLRLGVQLLQRPRADLQDHVQGLIPGPRVLPREVTLTGRLPRLVGRDLEDAPLLRPVHPLDLPIPIERPVHARPRVAGLDLRPLVLRLRGLRLGRPPAGLLRHFAPPGCRPLAPPAGPLTCGFGTRSL